MQHLVSFLGETVKVFGADRLRSTKFLLPVDEAEIFLDDLQKMAPYSLKDLVDAAKAGKCKALLRVCKQSGALNAARCRRFYDGFRDKDSTFICGSCLMTFPWCDRVGTSGFLDAFCLHATLFDLFDSMSVCFFSAGAPVLCAFAARFFFLQLTEAVVAFGAAAEATAAAGSGVSAAAGAAAAGEAAAAATGAASVYSVCSTAFALTPWALLVGGCVYGVVRGVRKLHNVREKVFLCPTTDSAETDSEIGLPQGMYRDHCVIKWG